MFSYLMKPEPNLLGEKHTLIFVDEKGSLELTTEFDPEELSYELLEKIGMLLDGLSPEQFLLFERQEYFYKDLAFGFYKQVKFNLLEGNHALCPIPF